MLRFIQRPETDPYYNLAAEEYIFKTAGSDTFMIWRNEPSVIIGKHQNALKEINSSFLEKNKIPVIRRITGGGTVYHDPGNINFSFIFTQRKENLVDFREFTKPIILFLQNLGLNAAFEGKNNITVNAFKVSGNSAHLFKNKVLYHGTLLFDSNLEMLENAIAGKESNFQDKAVKSIRAKTFNINQLLKNIISTEDFISQFQTYIFNYFEGYYKDDLSDEDQDAINKLADEKYRSFQWNYGYSPDYEFYNEWIFEEDEYSVSFDVKKGVIQNIAFSGSDISLLKNIELQLNDCIHELQSISGKLNKIHHRNEKDGLFLNQLALHLF